MKIKEIFTKDDEDAMKYKMTKQFTASDNYTSSWKASVENVGRDYLLPKPETNKVKIRVIENLLRIRKSVFLSDTLQVTSIPKAGILGKEVASNTNKVLEFLYSSMDMRGMYEDVLIDDALQGVGVLTIKGWNDYDQEPIVGYVDSRLTYPDPNNWRGNKMLHFGTLLRESIYSLENNNSYDESRIEEIRLQKSKDLENIDRANNQIKGFTDVDVGEEQVDLYNHLNIFKSSKDKEPHLYLTTWGANRTTLIRAVKIRALTETEKADPSKITLGVHLFRSHPIKGSYAGASLIDDSGQYQELKTLMSNLLIRQTIEAGMGGKTFVDVDLGIDLKTLAKAGPGIIPMKSNNPQKNAQNSILNEPPKPNNPIIQTGIGTIDMLNQEATNMSGIAQGQSLSGTQTKAEIQTLSQNMNQGIMLMQDSYIATLVGFWTDILRSFAVNMSPQKKKEIVTMDTGNNPQSYGLKKNEFVPKGDIYIKIKSKAQEDIKNKQDFAVLSVLYGQLRPNASESVGAYLDRFYADKSGIRGLKGIDIVPYTPDERKALSNLTLLNNNEELSTKPEVGEDHNTFIRIYNTGLQTDAQIKAIREREIAIKSEPKQQTQPQGTDGTAKQLGASMLASDNAQQGGISSLADVGV